jgi:hypothetical protein
MPSYLKLIHGDKEKQPKEMYQGTMIPAQLTYNYFCQTSNQIQFMILFALTVQFFIDNEKYIELTAGDLANYSNCNEETIRRNIKFLIDQDLIIKKANPGFANAYRVILLENFLDKHTLPNLCPDE